jgi:hypothetical protein
MICPSNDAPHCDLIMVRVDPVSRPEVPRTLHDIYERSAEIGFTCEPKETRGGRRPKGHTPYDYICKC